MIGGIARKPKCVQHYIPIFFAGFNEEFRKNRKLEMVVHTRNYHTYKGQHLELILSNVLERRSWIN